MKGYQVPPAELEGLLLQHEHITDSAVIGIEDERSGEVPKAFVVLAPNVSIFLIIVSLSYYLTMILYHSLGLHRQH